MLGCGTIPVATMTDFSSVALIVCLSAIGECTINGTVTIVLYCPVRSGKTNILCLQLATSFELFICHSHISKLLMQMPNKSLNKYSRAPYYAMDWQNAHFVKCSRSQILKNLVPWMRHISKNAVEGLTHTWTISGWTFAITRCKGKGGLYSYIPGTYRH